jgi:hypothetical protein
MEQYGLLEMSIILLFLSSFLFTRWMGGMRPYKDRINFGGLVFNFLPTIGWVTTGQGRSYMIFLFPVSGVKHFIQILRDFLLIRISWFGAVISFIIVILTEIL